MPFVQTFWSEEYHRWEGRYGRDVTSVEAKATYVSNKASMWTHFQMKEPSILSKMSGNELIKKQKYSSSTDSVITVLQQEKKI